MQESSATNAPARNDLKPVLMACCLAMLAVGDNSTAIMAALPAMTENFRLGASELEWVVNAYLLTAAIFIIVGGDAADQVGARRSSIAGIVLFAIASLVIALAPAGFVVIGARALQGLGAAFAVAGTLAAVSEAATDTQRASAIGAWSAFLMLGFSIGPLVGGAIAHYAGWRFVFWLNVIAMVPAAWMLWSHPAGGGRRAVAMDGLGLAILAVFMVTLISGLQALGHVRTSPAAAIAPLVLATIALVALIRNQTRRGKPLVDFRLFAIRNFAISAGLLFLVMFAIMTLLLYFNLFAQSAAGLGLSAVGAGLSLLPLSIALFLFARAAPGIAEKYGMRRMMAGGSLLLVLGCAIIWLSLHIGREVCRLVARPVHCRPRHRAGLCLRAAARACGAAAGAGGQRLRHAQFLQFSGRHGGRHLWRPRVRAVRISGRAGAARRCRAGECRAQPAAEGGVIETRHARA